jgi:hypothetical protein
MIDSVIRIPKQIEISQECINIHGISKEICDSLFSQNLIYGCGKPFKIDINSGETYNVIICEYI